MEGIEIDNYKYSIDTINTSTYCISSLTTIKNYNLFNLWKSDCEKELFFKMDKEILEIRKNSLHIMKILELSNQILDVLRSRGVDKTDLSSYENIFKNVMSSCPVDSNTNKLLNECKEKYEKRKEKLESLFRKIEAALEGCETYEQEISVLKAYKVIDENGVLQYEVV